MFPSIAITPLNPSVWSHILKISDHRDANKLIDVGQRLKNCQPVLCARSYALQKWIHYTKWFAYLFQFTEISWDRWLVLVLIQPIVQVAMLAFDTANKCVAMHSLVPGEKWTSSECYSDVCVCCCFSWGQYLAWKPQLPNVHVRLGDWLLCHQKHSRNDKWCMWIMIPNKSISDYSQKSK